MDSDIKICSRKYEDEITEEEKNRIDFLSKQYIRNIKNLKSNEEKIKLKNKFGWLFVLCFIFTWGATLGFIIMYISNKLLQTLISIAFIYLHIYVYIEFANSYTKNLEKESDDFIKEIDNITEEMDVILKRNKINIEEFYKELNSNVK